MHSSADLRDRTSLPPEPGGKGGDSAAPGRCRVAVLWIDWYAYHVARFEGLRSTPELREPAGTVVGLEMVGGIGVHAGLKFREPLPAELRVETLMPASSWGEAGQVRLARAVWRALDRLDPEVVLVPGYYTLPALAAAVWARVHGRTGVLMTESTAADHRRSAWKERLKGWLIRGLFRWAVAGGAAHVRYLRQLGFAADRIARFYDVVDNERYGEQATELRRSSTPAAAGLPETPYFLYVGRLAPEKNVEALVGAWLRYRAEGGAWGLVLVGDGPSAAGLRATVKASGYADEVQFAGLRPSRELPPFYAFAGAFVLPSMREPWGLVVNEAMASGLPVVVSDRCGCAEDLVRHGRNGLVFDPSGKPGTENELRDCLHLMSGFSAEKLAAMRMESIERVGEYSPANFGLEIAGIVRREGLRMETAGGKRRGSGRGFGQGRGRTTTAGASGRAPRVDRRKR